MSDYQIIDDRKENHGLEVLKACIRATCHICAAKPGSHYSGSTLKIFGGMFHHHREDWKGFSWCKANSIRKAFAYAEEVHEG